LFFSFKALDTSACDIRAHVALTSSLPLYIMLLAFQHKASVFWKTLLVPTSVGLSLGT
jgi:hypothetical protein